jgi:hypothetical protein
MLDLLSPIHIFRLPTYPYVVAGLLVLIRVQETCKVFIFRVY